MEIIKINLRKPNIKTIKKAARLIKDGGVVIYPTDTCYGIGASAFDKEAIRKVFEIKGRDFNNPISIIVKNLRVSKTIAEINEKQEKYFLKKLPGKFTLIFKKRKIVPDELTAGLDTIGIRIPNYSVIELLSHEIIIPYTTTSANISGQPQCYSLKDLLKQFRNAKLVDLILDAGSLTQRKVSTVIDLSKKKPKILR
jgi:L-threonylcarbamoyladenylate synthase